MDTSRYDHMTENNRSQRATERHIQRLLKAGFVEVEPVKSDWQFFSFVSGFETCPPGEVAREWHELQRESRERLGLNEKSLGEMIRRIGHWAV